MRTCKTLLAFLVISAVMALTPMASHAAWPTTTATVCWSAGGGEYIKARITPTGGDFFSVQLIGIGLGKIFVVEQGAAYVRGNYVYWTSAGAGRGTSEMWASQTYIVINKTTLAGRSDEILHVKDLPDGSLSTEYKRSTSTLTPVSCSVIWQ